MLKNCSISKSKHLANRLGREEGRQVSRLAVPDGFSMFVRGRLLEENRSLLDGSRIPDGTVSVRIWGTVFCRGSGWNPPVRLHAPNDHPFRKRVVPAAARPRARACVGVRAGVLGVSRFASYLRYRTAGRQGTFSLSRNASPSIDYLSAKPRSGIARTRSPFPCEPSDRGKEQRSSAPARNRLRPTERVPGIPFEINRGNEHPDLFAFEREGISAGIVARSNDRCAFPCGLIYDGRRGETRLAMGTIPEIDTIDATPLIIIRYRTNSNSPFPIFLPVLQLSPPPTLYATFEIPDSRPV